MLETAFRWVLTLIVVLLVGYSYGQERGYAHVRKWGENMGYKIRELYRIVTQRKNCMLG